MEYYLNESNNNSYFPCDEDGFENDYIYDLKNGRAIIDDTANEVLGEPCEDYNCGGFALGTFTWYLPYSHDEKARFDRRIRKISDYYDLCTARGRFFMDNMLEEFSNVREIENVEELEEDERLVLFRASQYDFHYVRQLSDGSFAHKPGCSEICEMDEEEVFSSEWSQGLRDDYYSGRIYMMAIRGKSISIA